MEDPNPAIEVEEEEEEEEEEESQAQPAEISISSSCFPTGRVKKIVKLDRDINKVTSEALHLISLSAHHFLSSLAAASAEAAKTKKRKIIKLDHVRSAVRTHPSTSDFLLDCLPNSSLQPSASAKRSRSDAPAEKPLPPGVRRIDNFFQKATAGAE